MRSRTPLLPFAILLLASAGCGAPAMAPCPEVPAAPPPAQARPSPPPESALIPHDLPRADELSGVQPILTVDIAADGARFVDGKSTPEDGLFLAAARAAATRDPAVRAVIHADKQVPFERVVRAMDLLKQAGISKLAFGVTIAPPDSPLPAGKDGSASKGVTLSPPPTVDGSQAPQIDPRQSAWGCPFPPDSDAAGIDEATVTLRVTVDAAGSAAKVDVLSESPAGHGFGATARKCALARRYVPGRDPSGNPVTAATPPIRVRFVR